jgi:hypothetical protein
MKTPETLKIEAILHQQCDLILELPLTTTGSASQKPRILLSIAAVGREINPKRLNESAR